MQTELVILLSYRDTPALRKDILDVVPNARFLTSSDIESDPSLVGSVEIVYGKFDPALFPQALRLKWVQATSAGADWVLRPEVQSHPAIVTNARIHAEPISQHLFGMLLMLTRGLNIAHSSQAEHKWNREPYPHCLYELRDKTLCIVGLGVIGQRCAELGVAFGMHVVGVRRHKKSMPHVEEVFGEHELKQALALADIVMAILPGTARARKSIGSDEFAVMRKGSFFLNAGRGSTVDTQALVNALRDGTVRGAGLDVFDPEPLPPDHALWDMPNVIITPHIGGLHPSYEKEAAELFLENLRRFISDRPLRNVVDKAEGY